LEEAEIEVESDDEEEEVPEEEYVDQELVGLVENVHSDLTPEDPADIDKDTVLSAIAQLNDYEGAK